VALGVVTDLNVGRGVNVQVGRPQPGDLLLHLVAQFPADAVDEEFLKAGVGPGAVVLPKGCIKNPSLATGMRFVGDSIQSFSDGDLVLLEPNVPHLWRSGQRYHEEKSDLMTKVTVGYFAENFLGEAFFARPEMVYLDQLLKTSIRGLHWFGETHQFMAHTMQALVREQPTFRRVLLFLDLLDLLSHSTEYKPLTSPEYSNTMKPSETKRMQVVHNFVMENFQETVSPQRGRRPRWHESIRLQPLFQAARQ